MIESNIKYTSSHDKIAFVGYAGAGKDEAAKPLIARGWEKRAFGDIIKKQVEPIVQANFGFSAFTDDREKKKLIRRTLESWGEDNYAAISKEFFTGLPERCVNTRLCRIDEATRWVDLGGAICRIARPGVGPATPWEKEIDDALVRAKLITHSIVNSDTLVRLGERVLETFQINAHRPAFKVASVPEDVGANPAFRSLVVYVAGPFRAPNSWEVEQNIRRAEEKALQLWATGFSVICPHANTRFYQGYLPDNVWLEGDLQILRRCDAMFILPGSNNSQGTKGEAAHAGKHDIPVFSEASALIQWALAKVRKR